MSEKDRMMEYLEIIESKDEIEEAKESLSCKGLGEKAVSRALQIRDYLAEMALCLLPYGHTIEVYKLKTNGKGEIATSVCFYGILQDFRVSLEPEKAWEEKRNEIKDIVVGTFSELERQYVGKVIDINEEELSKARAEKEGRR